MENPIVVKKLEDLTEFLESRELQKQTRLNQDFMAELEKANNCAGSVSEKITDAGNKVINVATLIKEVKGGKTEFRAIITQEMDKALKDKTGNLYKSHNDGQIFPEIEIRSGGKVDKKFISLEEVKSAPNYANIVMLMNQMQELEKLTSIHDTLIDFAEETNRQLNCIQRDMHDNRIIEAEHAELNFNSFLAGDLDRNHLIDSINKAFPSLRKELEANLHDLEEITTEEFSKKQESSAMEDLIQKEQNLIKYIIEDSAHLQNLYKIEMYMEYMDESHSPIENDTREIKKKYSEVLIKNFTQERLELLSGLNTFEKNIWYDKFMPGIKNLKADMESVKEISLWKKEDVKENIATGIPFSTTVNTANGVNKKSPWRIKKRERK